MEVCINECAVVSDTRWEQINWLDDVTYIVHLVQGNWIMKRADMGVNKTAGWAMDRTNWSWPLDDIR